MGGEVCRASRYKTYVLGHSDIEEAERYWNDQIQKKFDTLKTGLPLMMFIRYVEEVTMT